MKEILLLGIIFTLPAWFIIIRNFLWDLYFWQKKNYSLERFITNILWDLDKDNKSYYLISAKFIIFAFLAIGFQYAISGLIGIVALLILWSFEAFYRLNWLFIIKEPRVSLTKPRNLISVLGFITFVIFTFLLITLPFVSTVTTQNYSVNYQILQSQNIPSAYIYLLILYSVFLLIDLSTAVITIISQVVINYLIKLRRFFKLLFSRQKYSKLKSKNTTIVLVGENYFETSQLLKYGLEKTVSLEINSAGQFKEFILDQKVKNKIVFAKIEHNDKAKILHDLMPDIIVFNQAISKVSKLIKNIPLSTTLIVNADLYSPTDFTEKFSGNIKFFSEKHNFELENHFLTKIISEKSNLDGINASFDVNKFKLDTKLYTLNKEYLTSLAIALNIVATLNKDLTEFNNAVQQKFKENTDALFIPGDNNTKLISYENTELSYQKLLKNIISVAKLKEDKNLIVVSNGVERKTLPLEFYKQIKEYVDLFITNDNFLNKNLAKNAIQSVYINSFRNASYEVRKASLEGDFILIEGHFKEPIVKILKS